MKTVLRSAALLAVACIVSAETAHAAIPDFNESIASVAAAERALAEAPAAPAVGETKDVILPAPEPYKIAPDQLATLIDEAKRIYQMFPNEPVKPGTTYTLNASLGAFVVLGERLADGSLKLRSIRLAYVPDRLRDDYECEILADGTVTAVGAGPVSGGKITRVWSARSPAGKAALDAILTYWLAASARLG